MAPLTRLAALATAGLMLSGMAVAQAAPSRTPSTFDYTKVAGLSKPSGRKIERLKLQVPAADGTLLYVEVVKPAGAGRFPVILEASPYHGTLADRDGTRILPEPRSNNRSLGLTGFFAPRGYAVVMMDLRGTGRSQGCLDHLGPKDAKDLKRIVEWAASQRWSTGRVGMTGHSYVGSTPMVAAAQKPRGLTTIVPSAGLASMYDHQFQGGVPYFLQYTGPQVAYEALAINRSLPPGFDNELGGESGDNFGKDPGDLGCGLPQSAALAGTGQVTGQYEGWHAARDWSKGATAAKLPVFLVHGVNDNAARIPAADWFMDRGARRGDKAWIGQWDHGSGFGPNRRGLQWPYALLGWFDKHLKRKSVSTGPAVEAFLNNASTLPDAIVDKGQRQTLIASGYPTAKPTLRLFPDATGGLPSKVSKVGVRSFTGSPQMRNASTSGLSWTTPKLTRDLVLAGVPELTLTASVTSPQVHLIANLYDRSPNGDLRRISQFALNPLLREGLHKISPIVPGEPMKLKLPAFAMAHRLVKGHSLVLRLATTDDDKVPTFTIDARISVATGPGATELRLPVVKNPRLVKDSLVLFDD
jgi:pimeloyl-ACP methyl ester carboxylesterase